ncbi:MAG: 3-deoxy-D-manno-octulosonic acid transferase, partial [Cytophagales bacterium]|nr:3-deoxy-D-manno-octulosonic acid transferase [Cytophagales bacterium]
LVQPKFIFFIKYEFWYHYLNEAQSLNIPTFLIAAIFRKEQLFFKPYGKIFRKMLQKFKHIFVQNKASIHLLQQINIQQVTDSGDTRFDSVQEIRMQVVPIPLIEKFKLATPLLVIGSSWPEDIAVLLPYINQTENKIKFIIAPHEINEHAINALQQKIWKPIIRFSGAASVAIQNFEVLIIDNIGMLAALYQYADFAYVGGAFKQGLHNILEPATFGMPIFFGNKKYDSFPEACDLIEQGCAFAITDAEHFQKKFSEIYENLSIQKAIAQKTAHYVACNTGATEKIMAHLKIVV